MLIVGCIGSALKGKMMIWIGLTGGMGSGKSTVATGLRARGWPVIDADQLAREVLVADPGLLAKVRAEFGDEVFTTDGQLDRRELGLKVFGQKARLEVLEAIIHPAIQREVLRLKANLKSAGEKLAIYDVPLLFEKGLQKQFDQVILIVAPLDLRRQRIRQRDQLDEREIDARMASQIPLEHKIPQAHFVLDNSGNKEDLAAEMDRLQAYLQTQT